MDLPDHEEHSLPPLHGLGDRLQHVVYRSNSSVGEGMPTATFRVASVLPLFRGMPPSQTYTPSVVVGLKALVKQANRKRLTATLANGSMAVVRFEAHIAIWDTEADVYKRTPNGTEVMRADEDAIYRSLVYDEEVSAVIISFSATGNVLRTVNYLEALGVLSFTFVGDGSDLNPFNGERYRFRWDVTPPLASYSKPYLRQLSLLARTDARLQKVAFLALQGFDQTAAMQAAESMGLQVVLEEKVPSLYVEWTPLGLGASGSAQSYWRALALNVSRSGASSVLYEGFYEALELARALKDLDINLPGSIWSVPFAIDPSYGYVSVEHTQLQFTSSYVVTKLDVPDPLYGSVGGFYQMLQAEFGFGPTSGFVALTTIVAAIGTILTEVMQQYSTAEPEIINRKMPSLSLPDSLLGSIRFGAHRYGDEQATKLFQFFDGRLTPVMPPNYAERLIMIPVPEYSCRGNNSIDDPRNCACSPGMVGNQDSMRCVPCPAGYESAGGMGAHCRPCGAGFNSRAGARACAPCAAGTFSDRPALAECSLCSMGMYTTSGGQSHCDLCPRGRFAALTGSTECSPCGGSLTTASFGGISEQDCTCPASTYFVHAANSTESGSCLPCGEGLRCLGGRAMPLQEEGYQVVAVSDGSGAGALQAFRCQDELRCPGGTAIGSCPPHRLHLACEYCEAGMRPGDDGTCSSCDGNTWLEAFLFGSAGLAFLVGLAYFAKAGTVRIIFRSRLNFVCCLSITATTGQIFSTFDGMDVALIHPLSGLKRLWGLFSISLDVLEMGCTLGISSTVEEYSTSMAFYPLILLLFVCVFGVLCKGCRMKTAELWNGLGHLFILVYLPATLLALSPFRCGSNPSGRSTLVLHRSVICWEGTDHHAMVAISVISVLAFPVSFLAFVAQATWAFPRRLASAGCHAWLRWNNFIFQRFKPENYYYGIIHLLRSFCIGILPVLCVNEPELHILLLGLILVASGLLQALLQPWRSGAANILDIVITTCCCVTLTAAALVFHGSAEHTLVIVEVFLTVNVVVLFGAGVTALLFHMLRTWRPPKPYGVFLSHHKGGGGVLARLFKMLISTRVGGGIFLDSDELDDLDILVSTIAYSSKNVIVLLTRQTLLRFWCAMELAAALRPGSGVKVVPAACEDYEPPDDEFLDSLPSLWQAEDIAVMATHGIALADVRQAYERLRNESLVRLHRSGGLAEIEMAVDQTLERCTGLSFRARASQQGSLLPIQGSNSQGPRLIITGAVEDPESLCACYVLQLYFQREMEAEVIVAQTAELLSEFRGAAHLVVVLTRGILRSPAVQEVLLASEGMHLVPVQADGAFAFPDIDFYRSLQAQGGDSFRLVGCYQELFRTIALVFSPYASQETQMMEVRAIKRRSRLERDSMRLSKASMGSAVLEDEEEEEEEGDCDNAKPLPSVLDLDAVEDVPSEQKVSHWRTGVVAMPGVARTGPAAPRAGADL